MTLSAPATAGHAVHGQAPTPAAGHARTPDTGRERADLLAMLAKHRHFLRFTTRGLTDEQAGQRTTASELCLGGLIKHVTAVEQRLGELHPGGAGGDEGCRRHDAGGLDAAYRGVPAAARRDAGRRAGRLR